jgi:LysR family carnitine catabolism transcriptional activator
MDLAQLEAVVAVDDHGSFSAAAGALLLTQPALSRRVATLEAELGLLVFERVGRGVRLTDAGRAVLASARRMLHERRQLLAAVHDVAGVGTGQLDVAGLPSMIATHLVDVIGAFRSRHPGIEVTVTGAADTAELEALVSSARCDIGIADLPIRRAGLRSVSLGTQELMAVFPPGSALPVPATDGVPVVTEAELRSWPLVVLPAPTSSRALVDEVFARSSAGPRVGVTSDLRDLLVPLVLRGAGAALVPDRIAAEAAAQGGVVARVRPRVRREVGLVLREGEAAPAVAAFIDLVLDIESSRRRGARHRQPAAAPAGATLARRTARAAASSSRRR